MAQFDLRTIFEKPTVAKLVAYVEEALEANSDNQVLAEALASMEQMENEQDGTPTSQRQAANPAQQAPIRR